MVWTCESCTFENADARSRCEICDTAKPKPSAAPPARASPVQAGPPPPAAAARPVQQAHKVSEADVKALTDMGFGRADAVAALEATGNKTRATDWLIQNGKAQSPPPVARTASKTGAGAAASASKQSAAQPSKPAPAPAASGSAAKPAPVASAASLASAPRVGPSVAAAPAVSVAPASRPAPTSVAKVVPIGAPAPALSPVPTYPFPPNAAAASAAAPAAHKPVSTAPQPAIPSVPKQSLPLPSSQPQAIKPVNAAVSMPSATPAPRPAGAPVPSGKAEAKFEEPPQKSEAEKEAERKARQEALEAHRLAKLEEEQKAKMERLKKDQEREEKRKAEEEERRQKRLAQEQQLKDIPTALKYIEENYEITRLRELCKIMCTIVRNILKSPNEEKFRVINTKNPTIHRAITRPLGGIFILKQLGFTDKADAADHMILEKPNLKLLQSELKRFESFVSRAATIVPQLLKSADQKHNAEAVYFAAEELRNIFGNVVAAGADDGYTNGKNFRTVDTESAAFQKRIKPIDEAVQILKDFGYKPEHDTYLVVDQPDVSKFEAGFQDCSEELKARGGNTAIAVAVRQLLKANNWALILSFVEKMNAVLLRIINDPHDTKYHRVKLEPFFAKLGVVDGGTQFFERFGFKLDPVANVAVMPYPESNGFDHDLLKRRFNDLNRVWKEEMAAAQLRRDAEEEAKLAQERAARVSSKPNSNNATPLPHPAVATPSPVPTFPSTGRPNVAAVKPAPVQATAHTAVAQKGRAQGPSSITQTTTSASSPAQPVVPVNKPTAKPTNPPAGQRK